MQHIEKQDPAGSPPGDTARLVELFAGQIGAAIDEAFAEIDALSQSLLATAKHASLLSSGTVDPTADGQSGQSATGALSAAVEAAAKISFARLQFTDRLHQRLSNVQRNLLRLAGLLEGDESVMSQEKWAGFLGQTRDTFTMEHEREMFDRIFSCGPELDASLVATVGEFKPSQEPTLFGNEVEDD